MDAEWGVWGEYGSSGVEYTKISPPIRVEKGGGIVFGDRIGLPGKIGVYDADGRLQATYTRVDGGWLGDTDDHH